MSRIASYLARNNLPNIELELIQEAIRRDKEAPFTHKFLLNALPYSYYAYGVYHGCRLAKLLKIPRVSVIEFGVAGGNGLVALEQHAATVSVLFGVEIDVYGFDTGAGMTPPKDYRDMPYRFAQGNYSMDVPKLKARLKRAQLVLGDIKETAAGFFANYAPAPICFASFDMDYYSATMDAFSLFQEDRPDGQFLPRMQFYFDDVTGHEISSYNEYVGELAAIKDFNAANGGVKIAQSQALKSRALNFEWYQQIYLMHRFKHGRYNDYVSAAGPTSLSLKP